MNTTYTLVIVFLLLILAFIGGKIYGENIHQLEITSSQVFIECEKNTLSIKKPDDVAIYWNKSYLTQENISDIKCGE